MWERGAWRGCHAPATVSCMPHSKQHTTRQPWHAVDSAGVTGFHSLGSVRLQSSRGSSPTQLVHVPRPLGEGRCLSSNNSLHRMDAWSSCYVAAGFCGKVVSQSKYIWPAETVTPFILKFFNFVGFVCMDVCVTFTYLVPSEARSNYDLLELVLQQL